MISKQLLSEVLSLHITNVSRPYQELIAFNLPCNHIDIEVEGRVGNYKKQLNLHELAHKCKEWAHTYKLSLRSFNGYKGWFCVVSSWNDSAFKSKKFKAETEPEAIFKASQWILDTIND